MITKCGPLHEASRDALGAWHLKWPVSIFAQRVCVAICVGYATSYLTQLPRTGSGPGMNAHLYFSTNHGLQNCHPISTWTPTLGLHTTTAHTPSGTSAQIAICGQKLGSHVSRQFCQHPLQSCHITVARYHCSQPERAQNVQARLLHELCSFCCTWCLPEQ